MDQNKVNGRYNFSETSFSFRGWYAELSLGGRTNTQNTPILLLIYFDIYL